MSHRKILGILLVLSFIVLCIGLIFMFNQKLSAGDLLFAVGKPLVFEIAPIIVVLFFLLFFSKEVFNLWRWFALVLIPIFAIWIFSTPTLCTSLICFDRTATAWYSSVIFLFISLIVIITKTILLRRKKI